MDVQATLDNIQPHTLSNSHIQLDHTYHNAFTTPTPSPMLKDTNFSEISVLEDVPNPTKHQQKMYNIPNFQLYKNKKEPLPSASNPNIKVNANWNENIIHNTPQKRLLKTYKPVTLVCDGLAYL